MLQYSHYNFANNTDFVFLQAPAEEATQGEEVAIIQDNQHQVIFQFYQFKANISRIKKVFVSQME